MSVEPLEHPLFDRLKSKKFILCSTSPRRQEIVDQMGIKNVQIYPSNFPEDLNKSDHTPEEYVQGTAVGKILNVWEELKNKKQNINVVLLAADTVVENEGNIYEKPASPADNAASLKKLRDSKTGVVNVLSGVVLLTDNDDGEEEFKMAKFVEKTVIEIDRDMSDEFIDRYAATGEGLSAAGGFRIQKYGGLMIKGISGDYMNVVGLPMNRTFKELCAILDCPF